MTIASRTEGLGAEVKLRILLGTYVLRSGFQDEYYLRAQKIRTAIRMDFRKAFEAVDLVLMPVYPVPPFERGSAEADPFSQKLADIFTCAANLAGLPAMSFPAAVEAGLPIGMQFLAPPFAEELLFAACRQVEKVFPSPDAPGYPTGGGSVYTSFLGLEVHTQLLTRTKVFCGCRAAFGDAPNTNICPVCMGYPGVLPTLNAEAIRMGCVVARALNCTLSPSGLFERKNYFYPDLPKNYQISQFRSPLGTDGWVEIELRKRRKRVRIREVHLEEDAGKMIHAGDVTFLDFNRTGTPLLEIVTQPDMEVGEEAEVFLMQLRRLVRYLGVCDGNMEEGSLRCDANVSVNTEGKGLGSKVEVKNLNSFKFVRKAVSFEIERQTEILERGGSVTQETRLWNENRDVTESMRTKESSSDYRYFPEPDLPPFAPDEAFLRGVEQSLVELPEARKRRLIDTFQLSEDQADFLCEEKATADYYEKAIALGADPRSAALWLASDVKKLLNRTGALLAESPLTPARLAELLTLLALKKIHGRIAKSVVEAVFAENKDPGEIIREKGWEQITDTSVLGEYIEKVMAAHPAAVSSIRSGDNKPTTFLVGEIMRETSGRADPALVQSLVKKKLAVSVIQILALGGAIAGTESEQGEVVPGDPARLMGLLEAEGTLPRTIAFEEGELGRILSEEITPLDWARLLMGLDERLRGGRSAGHRRHARD